MTTKLDLMDTEKPFISLKALFFIFSGLTAGVILAAAVLPAWLPDLTASLLGSDPKAFWFLSRGSALVAYGILWLSMIFGLLITNKTARIWPGGPKAFDLHQFFSLSGLAFGLFHGLILIGDHYINYNLAQIAVPFASVNYQPFWVGIGQISFYLWTIIVLSFYFRRKIGNRTWRLIHVASFITFLLALIHGIASGTDTVNGWVIYLYWITGSSIFFLLVYRILISNLREVRPVLTHK